MSRYVLSERYACVIVWDAEKGGKIPPTFGMDHSGLVALWNSLSPADVAEAQEMARHLNETGPDLDNPTPWRLERRRGDGPWVDLGLAFNRFAFAANVAIDTCHYFRDEQWRAVRGSIEVML